MRASRTDPQSKITNKMSRAGVYAVTANPFHWAHLLIGLGAMAEFKLDKIVYILAGGDPRKLNIVSAEIRHSTGQKVLDIFQDY